ncbi:hypothetical protein JCM3770_003444 [Rhodotorula araucariae]
MVLDLAQPRAIRPLIPPPEPLSSPQRGGSAASKAGTAASAAGEPRPTPRARTAIHVRLTEDVLRDLLELARNGPAGAMQDAIRLDLGAQPAFVVKGVSLPLSLHPEAPNTELVRLSSSSRDLQPIAAVTHRATIQHSKADLEKAGQRARENRQLAEKEKGTRRAVLLDSAPSKAFSRSSSLNRSVSRAHTPLSVGPSSAPTSRTASPVTATRQPSRLTAVPPKPPTGSTFRIGKGAVPASIALSRGTSSSSSSGTGGGAGSPPRPAPAPESAAENAVPAAARQDSTSSTSSGATSSEASLLHKTRGASVTSPESLTLAEAVKPAPLLPPRTEGRAPEAAITKSPVRAGGGLMKGKETLKKGKRRDERVRDRSSAASATAPTKRASLATLGEDADADGEEDAPGEPDEDTPPRPAAKKTKRGVDVGVDGKDAPTAAGASSRALSSPRHGGLPATAPAPKPAVKTKVVTKVVAVAQGADRGSGSDASRSDARAKPRKDGGKRRARERTEGSPSPPPASPAKKKQKKKEATKRWYSSSEDDDDDDDSQSSTAAKAKARAPVPAKPLRRPPLPVPTKSTSAPLTRSPLRNSTSAAALRPSPPPPPPALETPVDVASAAEFGAARLTFFETYAGYAAAHARLTEERHRLERGEAGALAPTEVRRLVRDVERQHAQLEALRTGMKNFAGGMKMA